MALQSELADLCPSPEGVESLWITVLPLSPDWGGFTKKGDPHHILPGQDPR